MEVGDERGRARHVRGPAGRHDRFPIGNLPDELRTRGAQRLDPAGEPVVVPRRHDPQHRVKFGRRSIDARPDRHASGRRDEGRMPCRRPRRQQFVGLGLFKPRRKIVEAVAGQKNRDALECHGATV
jgi:hypothetical protein